MPLAHYLETNHALGMDKVVKEEAEDKEMDFEINKNKGVNKLIIRKI